VIRIRDDFRAFFRDKGNGTIHVTDAQHILNTPNAKKWLFPTNKLVGPIDQSATQQIDLYFDPDTQLALAGFIRAVAAASPSVKDVATLRLDRIACATLLGVSRPIDRWVRLAVTLDLIEEIERDAAAVAAERSLQMQQLASFNAMSGTSGFQLPSDDLEETMSNSFLGKSELPHTSSLSPNAKPFVVNVKQAGPQGGKPSKQGAQAVQQAALGGKKSGKGRGAIPRLMSSVVELSRRAAVQSGILKDEFANLNSHSLAGAGSDEFESDLKHSAHGFGGKPWSKGGRDGGSSAAHQKLVQFNSNNLLLRDIKSASVTFNDLPSYCNSHPALQRLRGEADKEKAYLDDLYRQRVLRGPLAPSIRAGEPETLSENHLLSYSNSNKGKSNGGGSAGNGGDTTHSTSGMLPPIVVPKLTIPSSAEASPRTGDSAASSPIAMHSGSNAEALLQARGAASSAGASSLFLNQGSHHNSPFLSGAANQPILSVPNISSSPSNQGASFGFPVDTPNHQSMTSSVGTEFWRNPSSQLLASQYGLPGSNSLSSGMLDGSMNHVQMQNNNAYGNNSLPSSPLLMIPPSHGSLQLPPLPMMAQMPNGAQFPNPMNSHGQFNPPNGMMMDPNAMSMMMNQMQSMLTQIQQMQQMQQQAQFQGIGSNVQPQYQMQPQQQQQQLRPLQGLDGGINFPMMNNQQPHNNNGNNN
jgi:hypothetical protein